MRGRGAQAHHLLRRCAAALGERLQRRVRGRAREPGRRLAPAGPPGAGGLACSRAVCGRFSWLQHNLQKILSMHSVTTSLNKIQTTGSKDTCQHGWCE